jgi:hypothetical protein
VRLVVYNLLGQVVATLVDGVEKAGHREYRWNASSNPSGIYFYRLDAVSIADPGRTFSQTRKMALLK